MKDNGARAKCCTPGCNFEIEFESISQAGEHVDKECPKCGKIYLTEDSYVTALAVFHLASICEKIRGDDVGPEVKMSIKITDGNKKP